MSLKFKALLATLALGLSLICHPGVAHEASSSYLYWQDSTPNQLRLDIALTDLLSNTFLRADATGALRWQNLLDAEAELARLLERGVRVLNTAETCASSASLRGLTRYGETVFTVWQFDWRCPASHIHYQLFAADDALHRALVTTQRAGIEQLGVLSPSSPRLALTLTLTQSQSLITTLRQFIYQGILHMWLGLDHVLFLLTLLMLVFNPKRDSPAGMLDNSNAKQLILVTTSFTLAHSITLILSSLSLLAVSSRVVETLIALSIVVSALKVLWPRAAIKTVAISFGFGLLHGLGFAGVLADLIAQTPSKIVALLGFNVGIEIAQLIIVVAAYPLLKRLQGHPRLLRSLFGLVASLTALCGAVWAMQRSGLV